MASRAQESIAVRQIVFSGDKVLLLEKSDNNARCEAAICSKLKRIRLGEKKKCWE